MNAYEAAREHLEQATASLHAAKRDKAKAEAYLLMAEGEWADAARNLRQYETTPGIPLPQYRELVQS